MTSTENYENAEKMPFETCEFTFSEQEYNEAMGLYFKNHIARMVAFGILVVAMIAYIAMNGGLGFVGGLVAGAEVVALWFAFLGFSRTKRSWKVSRPKICSATYNYELFEDYLLLDVKRNDQRVAFHRFDYADLQQKIDVGKYYLVVFANQVYIVKKQELVGNSLFHSLKPKAPEKPKKIFKVLSVVLIVLSVLSLIGAMIFMVIHTNIFLAVYKWWLLLFMPIPVASVVLGSFLKRNHGTGRANIFVGLICAAYIFGMLLAL